ncbi:uncharacterized protein [Typha angustifolia]|uniref:uncharacterized protein n=1 Tax=Typha angustifolia TaxID=59011 RepID=UPI003C2AC664
MASPPEVAELEDEGEGGVKWLKHYCSLHEILLVGEGDFSFSLSLADAFGSASNIVATSLDPHDVVVAKYAKAESNMENLKKMGAMILHGIDATKMKLHSDLTARKFDRIVFNFPHAGFKGKEDSMRMINLHRPLVRGFFKNASRMLRTDGEIHISHKTGGPFCKWNLEELALKNSLVLSECANFEIKEYPGYANKRGDGARCDQPFRLGNCCTFKFRICSVKKQGKKHGISRRSFPELVETEGVTENTSGTHDRQTIHHFQTHHGFHMEARHQPNFLMGIEPSQLSLFNQPTERLVQNSCFTLHREHLVGVNGLFQGFDPNSRHAILVYQRGVYVNEVDEERLRNLHAYARGGGHVHESDEGRHRSLHASLRYGGHVNRADEERRRSLQAYLRGGPHVNEADEGRHRILYAYLRGGGHVNGADEERHRSLQAYLRGDPHVNGADEERRRSLHSYLRGGGHVNEANEGRHRILHAYLRGGGHVNGADEERRRSLQAYLRGNHHVNDADEESRRSLHSYLRGGGDVNEADEERHRRLNSYLRGGGHVSEADEERRRSFHAYLRGGVYVNETDEERYRILHAYPRSGGLVNEAHELRRSLHAYNMGRLL